MTNKKTRGNFGCQAARLVRLSRLFGSQEGLTKLNTPGKAKLGPAGNTLLFEFGRKRRGKMLQRGTGRLWGAPAARAGSWALPRGYGGGRWVPQNRLLAPLFALRCQGTECHHSWWAPRCWPALCRLPSGSGTSPGAHRHPKGLGRGTGAGAKWGGLRQAAAPTAPGTA